MTDRDSELLRAFADRRSDDAFTELVRRNLNIVYGAALRQVGDPHSAADIAQSVFIDLARKAHRLKGHPALVGWLYKSVRYAASKTRRSELRRKTREGLVSLDSSPAHQEAILDWERVAVVVDDALQDLDERSRTAILLRFFKELSFAEVAAALQISEDNARQRTGRALSKLESVLRRRGITSTSAAISLALAAQPAVAVPASLSVQIVSAALASTASTGFVGALFEIATRTTHAKLSLIAIAVVAGAGLGLVFHRLGASDQAGSDTLSASTSSTQVPAASVAPLATATSTSPAAQSEPARADGRRQNGAARKKVDTPEAKAARQEARQESRRASLTRDTVVRRLTPLFEQLDLSPEKRERLIQLTVDDHEAGRDVAVAKARLGEDTTKEDYSDWTAAARKDYYDQVKQLLGDDGFEAFQANELQVRQNAVIEHLQKRLTSDGGQLSAEQSQRLLSLFNDDGNFAVTNSIIDRATSFLTPSQLEQLRVEQSRQKMGPAKPAIQRAIQNNLPKDH